MEIRERDAREIISSMAEKSLFEYIPEMEISVPETDRKASLDKMASCFRSEEITISDLFIGYILSLYKYTIPKVIAETIPIIGTMWPQKNVPRNIDRDSLSHRMKKMCRMGMMRRFVYEKEQNNIVLYSTTAEFAKIIYQALKLKTDARQDKDILPPIEIVEKAAASLVACELIKSPYLKNFDFMPIYQSVEGKQSFYAQVTHNIKEQDYITIIEPAFFRVDYKRFTDGEWYSYRINKLKVLRTYVEQLKKENPYVQIIFICADSKDLKLIANYICAYYPESYLASIYFSSEGAIKSGTSLKTSMIRITGMKQDKNNLMVLDKVSSKLSYAFF